MMRIANIHQQWNAAGIRKEVYVKVLKRFNHKLFSGKAIAWKITSAAAAAA